ncbi:hypothetical protein QW131_17625 [Roseibium salinum]|nr:hypothetical protein [Roseibium salinum]
MTRGEITHTIGFSGVSYVNDTTGAEQRVFADLTGQGQTLRIQDIGRNRDGMSLIDAAGTDALVSYAFANPNIRLTVDMGDGDDTFLHDGFDNGIDGKVLVAGGAGTDAVTGPPEDAVWNIVGPNSGDVAGVSFVEVENLIGSADNEDTFFVSESGSLSGILDGGEGGFDSLVLTGGTYDSVEYVAYDAHSGTVARDGDVLTYAGLEPITDNSNTTDRVIDLSAFSDTATLTESGGMLTVGDTDPFSIFLPSNP